MENNQPASQPQESKRHHRGLMGGLIILILGLLLLLQNFIPQLSIKYYGPVIMVVIGLYIIAPGTRK